jgi:NAD(P)-dependent dehydrogenase (short-subunit alcohol dehydrogenase family)
MLQYTVFITGANRGLGLEFARQYASDNWRVLASCRDLVHAKELQHLAQHFENITLLQLDVTNAIQLNQLADKFSDVSIDLLINNAAIRPEDDFNNYSVDSMKHAFVTNAIAPLKVSETFLNNLGKSHLKTIVAISSKLGSIKENNQGENYSYRTSKAALNMVMKNLAMDLKHKNIKVFTLHPGAVKNDPITYNSAINPEQSVTNIRNLLLRLTERDTGNFYDSHGNQLDW